MKTRSNGTTFKERIRRSCVVCGRKIEVILYKKGFYRGGHYFGKIPLFTKREMRRMIHAGTRVAKLGSRHIQVLKKDPKPYDYTEYWECPECHWGK